MKYQVIETEQAHILTDVEFAGNINTDWFNPDALQQQGLLSGTAEGRGSAWFVNLQDHECVLRHYFRGGLPGKVTQDLFFWNGLVRSRAWREWHLLAELQQLELPAPRPLAAHVQRNGWFYTCDLITHTIPDAKPLADFLLEAPQSGALWKEVGRVIAQFHHSGIYHADLNARNILVSADQQIFLIDFDRGRRISPQEKWQQANVQRLLRSLRKIAGNSTAFYFENSDWDLLMQGYEL